MSSQGPIVISSGVMTTAQIMSSLNQVVSQFWHPGIQQEQSPTSHAREFILRRSEQSSDTVVDYHRL